MSPRHRSLSAAKVQITPFESFVMHPAICPLSFVRLSSMSMEDKFDCHISEHHYSQLARQGANAPCLAYTADEIESSSS